MRFASTVQTALTGLLILAGIQAFAGAADGAGGYLRLLAPASAQAAEPLRLTDITFGNDTISVKVPLATVEGSSLPQQALQSLFAPSAAEEPLAARLAAFSAALVSIPEVIVTTKLGELTQVTRYFDVELRDIVNGVIATTTSRRATLTGSSGGKDGATTSSGSYGATIIEAFDTALAARLVLDGGESVGEPSTRLLHGRFSISDYRLSETVKSDGETSTTVAVTVDAVEGAGISARLPHKPLLPFFALLDSDPDAFDALSDDDRRTFLHGLADILSIVDIDKTIARNIAVTIDESTGARYTVALRSFETAYRDQQLTTAFDGLSFSGQAGEKRRAETRADTLSIGRFAIDDLSLKPTVAALREAASATPAQDLNALEGARMVPAGGRLSIADVSIDLDIGGDDPDTGPASDPERLAFSVKAFRTTLGSTIVDGKAHFETELTDLHARLPDTDADGLRELRGLGYEELTVSSVFRGNWNEATREAAVDSLTLSAPDVGHIAISARLGDIAQNVFSSHVGPTLAALEGASLHDLSLVLEDGGLFGRLVRQQAASGGGTEDEIRQQYAALATIGLPALIGDTATARKIAKAVSRFASAPGKLSIAAKARDPKGVPLEKLDSSAEPAGLIELFDITTSN